MSVDVRQQLLGTARADVRRRPTHDQRPTLHHGTEIGEDSIRRG